MDYTKYKIEDFASNESFIDWVNKSDPEAVKYWDLYLSTHPEIRDTVEKARILVLNLKHAERTAHDEAQVESIWHKIEHTVESRPVPETKVKRYRVLAFASATVFCVCVAAWFLLQENSGQQTTDYYANYKKLPDFVEQVNTTPEAQKVQLQDGSVVVLAANSSLKYKSDYLNDSTRSVYLIGEAFFDVTKNPYKPFIVHSNEILVKVLGTSFRVSAPENKTNVIVSVKTGKVSVSADNGHEKKDGVILLPNQQVKYERKEQSFEKTLIEAPEIVNQAIKETDFRFENTPITEVFKKMESAYGIEIIFNEEIMKKCYLTAPLGSEPMLEKLKIICHTIGASYEVIDANIVINSSGCQ
jgi:transmembrane sensor